MPAITPVVGEVSRHLGASARETTIASTPRS
jgi:hypothetical protein